MDNNRSMVEIGPRPGRGDSASSTALLPLIVVVSGASSTGKSTISRALASKLPGRTAYVEADLAFPDICNAELSKGEPPIVIFHRTACIWLEAGYSVVLDGSLPYGDAVLRDRCLAQLPSDRTVIAAITCSLEEQQRREASRPDPRPAGWGRSQLADINDGLERVITLDTSHGDTESHVALLLERLRPQS